MDIYSEIIKALSLYGEVLTEHVGDKKITVRGDEDGPNDEYIYNRDMGWLRETDVVVAEVTIPSLGVGYEIAKAEEWGKKVLCLYRETEGKRLSAMLSGSERLQKRTYRSLEDLKDIFGEFFESFVKKGRE